MRTKCTAAANCKSYLSALAVWGSRVRIPYAPYQTNLENDVSALFSRFFIFSRSFLVLYLSFIGSERRKNAAFFIPKQIAILAKSRAQRCVRDQCQQAGNPYASPLTARQKIRRFVLSVTPCFEVSPFCPLFVLYSA